MTTKFAANIPEDLAYIGPVLLIVLALFFVEFRKRRLARLLGVFMLAAAILSLGGVLRVAGETTSFQLPWSVVGELPFISHALPERFTIYVSLAAAVCIARGLIGRPCVPHGGWRRRSSW